MTILQSIVLGLIQGLTEFLPVSSSGHLVLAQKVMGMDSGSSTFIFVDTMLHLGTLIAVIFVLRREIGGIIRHPTGKLLRMLVLATVPTVVLALLLKNVFTSAFEGDFLGISFLITGIILIVSELLAARAQAHHKSRKFSEATFKDAFAMGMMQGIALVPGVSRSGSTLAGGLACGLNRNSVARFSFLMAVPAIIGSIIFQCSDVLGAADLVIPWGATIVGTLVAAGSGLLAATGMLKLIRKHKLYGFAFYVFILGALVLLDQLIFHVVFAAPFA